ncbi:MAG: PAS domain S-box protein [Proteobacteria bacterium]|nr:PAS domain S-box protein [Pseudomonadota bacterium]
MQEKHPPPYEDLTHLVEQMRRRIAELEKSETELKKVDAELRETDKKYRNIYENATEGIFQTTSGGLFITANPSLAHIHGYDSPDDLVNSVTNINSQLYVHPEDRFEWMALIDKYGSVQNYEVEMYSKDKSLHWISMNIKAVRDNAGNLLHYEGTMQDITQRKKAEKALIESEERYRTAIEHSNDGITIIQENKHLYVNRKFVEMFEYDKPEEIIGMSVTFVVHPDDHELVIDINKRRQRGESVPSRYEFKGITKTGKIIYVEISGTSTTYGAQPVYLIYLRDITARKKNEDALRTERNRLLSLSDNAPFGIAMIDKKGVYRYVNPKFKELFGYELKDIANGKEWFKRVFPDLQYRKQALRTWINDIKSSKQREKISRTFDATCQDRTKKTINFFLVQLITGDYLVTFDDITERIQAHEALIKSHKELESLNRAKTKAVHHISHELKTPLAVIQGTIRILKRKAQFISTDYRVIETLERNLERLFAISNETDEIFRASQEIEASVLLDDLDRILQRMKDISEIPPDVQIHWNVLKEWTDQFLPTIIEDFQSIDLLSFVRLILEKIKQAANHRHIHYSLEGVNNLFITINPVVLKEICEGIIKNAIENTPEMGVIRIDLEQKDDRIWIHVTDSGIGITDENQKYILDGLFHTKETDLYTSKKPYDFGAGGKGFELLRIKTYARRFGFDITFKSKRCEHIPTDLDVCPGSISLCRKCKTTEECNFSGGTTFSVSFPIKPAEHFVH